jgi:hypothetical protein
VRVKTANWTNQQAPGFWAQKSSNCCSFEPAAGVAVLAGVLVLGAVEPPLPVSPVAVSVLPDVVLSVLEESDEVLLSDELLSLLLELLSLFADADAAAAGAWADSGMATSAGGPGTCGASVLLPPQPAATSARRPAAMITARRGAPISLTPP